MKADVGNLMAQNQFLKFFKYGLANAKNYFEFLFTKYWFAVLKVFQQVWNRIAKWNGEFAKVMNPWPGDRFQTLIEIEEKSEESMEVPPWKHIQHIATEKKRCYEISR